MTTIVGDGDGISNDFDSDDLEGVAAGTLGAHSATQFVLSNPEFSLTAQGTGLTYSGSHPSGGTITSLTLTEGAGTATWSNFSVSVSTLWHAISTGDVTTFNNLFFSGDDTFNLQSDTGPDFLSGGAGNDTFNFGATFSDFSQIDGGTGNDVINLDGDYGYLTLGYVTNVETIKLGNDGHFYDLAMSPVANLTIDASALTAGHTLTLDNQWVHSGAMNVIGGAGDDSFVSGPGNDTYNGGAGTDTISYSRATGGVTVNLALTTPQAVGGGAGTDTLSNIENIVGTQFNDTLTGNSGNNVFTGGGGHDVITGGGGNDTVSFQDQTAGLTFDLRGSGSQTVGGDTINGVSSIIGTPYGDTFIGNSADNNFDSGGCLNAAYDTVDYEFATGGMIFNETARSYVGGTEDATFVTSGGGQGTDTITDFTRIIGTSGNDTFNFIWGLTPFIDGGGGNDTLNFQNSGEVVVLALAGSGGQSPNYNSVENIVGSAFNDQIQGDAGNNVIHGGAGDDALMGDAYACSSGGNDTIYGEDGNDTIMGGNSASNNDGNDIIFGGAGNDVLYGGGNSSSNDGNDTLDGGAGNDTLDGGDGVNTASYQDATGGVRVDLSLASPQGILTMNVGGGQGTDTLRNIQNLTGSAFNDTLTGDGNDNVLSGGGGNDVLAGGAGNNTLNGGNGHDTASYADAAGGVTVSLAVGGAQVTGGSGTDTLVSIENLTGSAFDDVLTGNSSSNILNGGAGDDTLDLSAGGNDVASGGNGDDLIVLGAAFTASDEIDGGAGADTVTLNGDYSGGVAFRSTTLVNVETIEVAAGHSYNLKENDANVVAGATLSVDGSGLGPTDALTFNGDREKDGAFVLKGGAGADVLIGGAGNDTIIGGLGADHLTGEAGANHFVYNSVAESTGAGFDTITGFNAAHDIFDLPGSVSARDHSVIGGALSAASFDSDMAAAIGAGQLAAGHAVFFVPNSGSYAGDEFLIVDANGVAGYQAGQDFVFLLNHGYQLSSLGAGNFI